VMFPLQPIFSLWVGMDVPDFLLRGDTVMYLRIEGYVIRAFRDSLGGWMYDTLMNPGFSIRRLAFCAPYLFLAYFRSVEIYVGDSLAETQRFPFKVEGLLCNAETLYIYDSNAIYRKLIGRAPRLLYSSSNILKQAWLIDSSIYVLEGNYLVALRRGVDTVARFEGLGDIVGAYPCGRGYILHFGSGELYFYYVKRGNPKATLLEEDVLSFKVSGDTLAILKGDSIRVYLLKGK